MPISDFINTSFQIDLEHGLYVETNAQTPYPFEKHFIKIRSSEERILSPEEIRKLPIVEKRNPHFQEWQVSSTSANKLVSYLRTKPGTPTILELGCGNGWLSNMLAKEVNSEVIGMDLQVTELLQAKEAFSQQRNLYFVYGNIYNNLFPKESFDTVVLAASIQYFENVNGLITQLFSMLKPEGEIHIVDTPLYTDDELEDAKQRSKRYFERQGYPEMERYYFHHKWDDIMTFHHTILYEPRSLPHRITRYFRFKALSPFPWIRITKPL